jgi:hypothetical protein
MMDEITLINLLNKICEKNNLLRWQLTCKYSDGMEYSVMEVILFDPKNEKKVGFINFQMENGRVIRGKYKGMVPFSHNSNLVDALLEILYYESTKFAEVLN